MWAQMSERAALPGGPWRMGGLGFGLPLSRLYARYFGAKASPADVMVLAVPSPFLLDNICNFTMLARVYACIALRSLRVSDQHTVICFARQAETCTVTIHRDS